MSGDTADLLARVRRLETHAELEELVTRYCMAVDDRDLDAIVELFTPDGSFGHEGAEVATGAAAIRAFYAERLSGIPYSIHYPHTQLVTIVDDEKADGVVVAQAEMGRLDAPPLRAAMRYHDTYRLHDGRFRFARRSLQFWYFAPVDEIDRGRWGAERVRWPGPPRPADLPDSLQSFAMFEAESVAREVTEHG